MQTKHTTRQSGQVLVVTTVLFLFISLSLVLSASSSVVRSIQSVRQLNESVRSYVLAESLNEDVAYRARGGMAFDDEEVLMLDGQTATATVEITSESLYIQSRGDVEGANRNVETELFVGSGASFNFGVQTGKGGFVMENNSSVIGNIFSNGTIEGFNNNLVKGDAISAGPEGLIDGINATGTAYAHTIQNSEVGGDAYYQTISNTTVDGTEHPGSDDQATTSLPISDEQIDDWEVDAEAGGVITGPCPYQITGDTTLGPVKINCDLEISGNNFTVRLAGMVWVAGDITISNSPTIKIDESLGRSSAALIADNTINRNSSSRITINNNVDFENSGTEGSYVLLVSRNEDAEQGGPESAVIAEENADGDVLFYSNHGEILLKNSVSLREVTAWRVRLQNFSEVIYETGLVSTLFTGGPSGGFVFNSWEEVE